MGEKTDFAALIEPVARHLFGEPNDKLSRGDELRFGSHGSLRVSIGGDHRGTWRDHESGDGGGVLDLIASKRGGDKASAAAWLSEMFPSDVAPPSSAKKIVATYPYTDSTGNLLFEVVRFEPKDFRQRRPDGAGGFHWNLKGVEPTLYRLPDVLRAVQDNERVYIVEGEKDADRLVALGFVATCNPGGAGKWKPQLAQLLKDARVAIIPDNDDVGIEHAETVARSLQGVAANVRVLELGEQARKADVSDWIADGGTVEQLVDITADTPDWRPSFKPRFPLVWFGREDAVAPMSWLVRGLMIDGGVSVVFGPPKSSKTFVVLDLALHVAHGRDWYGLRVKAGGVVYVCGEGSAGVRQRMKAWRQEKGGDTSAPFALLPQSINMFDAAEELDRLVADINGLADPMGGPVRLVVFDTVSRMIGGGDEDKARDINVLVRNAERVQKETGAHVLFVHHSGKDRDRGMRGSNAFLGAVDVAIEVSKDDTGLCEAKVTAIKDGGEIGPFTYTLRQSAVGTDEEGDDIVSCVIDPAGARQGGERGPPRRLTDADRHALLELHKLFEDRGTGGDIPQSVPVDTWRDRCYSSGTGSHEARKKAFQRCRDRLQGAGFIVISGSAVSMAEEAE
ncbi:AAA family ATPase [Sphingomonas sp. 28-63-12]|uniref:AAA family ATPase n=1 Tax=Sphingomonas sp. 28-63-12 TaxID=1970434 RepID=UPI000BD459F7|nr:MAG: hypothetical protein B7Y47_10135 [Sphingomonas sp. 28-63-12]